MQKSWGFKMIIRRGTIKDLKIIAEHWYKEEKLESKNEPMYKIRKNAKGIIIKELKKKFRKKDFIVFVAEDNGRVVGSFQSWIKKAYPVLVMDKIGHLAITYVEPAYRKRGVAKKLLNELISQCDKATKLSVLHINTSGRKKSIYS